jgi:hypothetical protein
MNLFENVTRWNGLYEMGEKKIARHTVGVALPFVFGLILRLMLFFFPTQVTSSCHVSV